MKQRVVLITGGVMGIGKATAERFAESGAKVVICDVQPEAGEATAHAVRGVYYRVDVADRQAVQIWIDDVIAKFERIDVLVNNAGIINIKGSLLVKVEEGRVVNQMPEVDFDKVIAVNLKGVFNCTQAVAPYMIKQKSGVILNASSIVGLDGCGGQTDYVATKAAVVGMTLVWARELGRYGVRVNVVAPGYIGTDIINGMGEKAIETMKRRAPLGRLGDPRDVANAYFFLASDEASFITGTVLRVDGGVVVGT